MKFHPDDVHRGCRTISSANDIRGWDTGIDEKGLWAEYTHGTANSADGMDYWSKGKTYFLTNEMREVYIKHRSVWGKGCSCKNVKCKLYNYQLARNHGRYEKVKSISEFFRLEEAAGNSKTIKTSINQKGE